MTTIRTGQLVEQWRGSVNSRSRFNAVGRVWELLGPEPTFDGATPRWRVRLHTLGVVDPGRLVGETSTCSETFLLACCRDWATPVIDPPQGDGEQTVWMVDGNDVCVEAGTFERLADMLQFVETHLRADPELTGQWFGWTPSTVREKPDMTVRLVEGELVWAE